MEAIVVAAIGSAGLVAQAWVSRQRSREVRAIKDTLGTKNGQGDVVAMLEHLKAWTLKHEGRHDRLEEQVDRLSRGEFRRSL